MMRKLEMPRKLGFLESIFGSTLAAQGTGWVKCSNGVIWKLDLADPTHRWIVYGDYEGGTGLNYARNVLVKGGVFVDSGSNIGQWVLYLGGLPGVQALEFEPVESQRNWLSSCLQLQADWNCTIYPWGLGAETREMSIQCDGARSTLRNDWYDTKILDRETIRIRRLEDVLREAEIDEVQLWKLDVEGAEYEALVGAGDYLSSQKIKHLYFECHHTNYHRNKMLLEACGYHLYDISRKGLQRKTDREILEVQDLVALPHSSCRVMA
jgi:FkbM family methyltransferase